MIRPFLYAVLLSFPALLAGEAAARFSLPPTDSWATAQKTGKASISLLWYDIEPFIYRNAKGGVMGVEYELMEGFKGYVLQQYGIRLTTNWVDAGSFESIYPYIKASKEKGLFGLSFYSITEERRADVKFSPAYMPDMNIVATNNSLPSYETDSSFIRDLPKMTGFTMRHTTMEEDLFRLKASYRQLPVYSEENDYNVLKQIAARPNAFGYVPLSIYVIGLQKGIKIKRQRVLATRRAGFAAIYTKESDWDEPVNRYFNSPECRFLVAGLIRKYLGAEVTHIILEVSGKDTINGSPADIELLTKEREIVTQRLIDTALDAERTKTERNITIGAGIAMLLFSAVLYSRFRTKHRMNLELEERNALIAEQKKRMEELNQHLQLKILQSKLNPHFLFNSLNSIQYHIGTNDKKSALQYISRFSAFLRQVLQSSDEMLIPTVTEARLAEQYLWLEQSRFPDRFDYTVTVAKEAEGRETPPLLIHTILETVLYHQILIGQARGWIRIEFSSGKESLQVTVCNSTGPSAGDLHTDNLLKRIDMINRAASQPITCSVRRQEEENELVLTIPQPLFTLKPC